MLNSVSSRHNIPHVVHNDCEGYADKQTVFHKWHKHMASDLHACLQHDSENSRYYIIIFTKPQYLWISILIKLLCVQVNLYV